MDLSVRTYTLFAWISLGKSKNSHPSLIHFKVRLLSIPSDSDREPNLQLTEIPFWLVKDGSLLVIPLNHLKSIYIWIITQTTGSIILKKLVGDLKPHKMDDKDFQRKCIESIFRTASFAPLFKPNPKYCLDQFAELTPYISYNDLKNNRIFIRGCPIGARNSQDSGKREVIMAYTTIEEMVEDGWRLTDKLETIKISQTQF